VLGEHDAAPGGDDAEASSMEGMGSEGAMVHVRSYASALCATRAAVLAGSESARSSRGGSSFGLLPGNSLGKAVSMSRTVS
jgi:hypothetical protein